MTCELHSAPDSDFTNHISAQLIIPYAIEAAGNSRRFLVNCSCDVMVPGAGSASRNSCARPGGWEIGLSSVSRNVWPSLLLGTSQESFLVVPLDSAPYPYTAWMLCTCRVWTCLSLDSAPSPPHNSHSTNNGGSDLFGTLFVLISLLWLYTLHMPGTC